MMMMMMMVMMGGLGCILLVSVACVVMQSSNDSSLNGQTTDPPGGSAEEGAENCYVVAQTKCDGVKGKKRDDCIGKEKKRCMSSGGYWDPSLKAKDEVKAKRYTIVQDWDGKEVDVPGSAVNDTNQNCVYFYDSGDWELSGAVPTNRGEWCIDRDGSMTKPLAIWHLKNKEGDRADESVHKYGFGDKMDYMRIGRNVKVTVYNDFNNGVGTQARVYYGDDPAKEGKLLIAGHQRNTTSGFKAERISK
jgi:hypothetical protein